MKKIFLCVFTSCIISSTIGQSKFAISAALKAVIEEIDSFNLTNWRADSSSNHPLGDHTEAHYLRNYSFYTRINEKLDSLRHSSLSVNDDINARLLQFSIEDEIATYKYKSFLNPILSDEGFHTSMAYMGSSVFSSAEEANTYLEKIKDMPRYVSENLELMRKGLSLGISQPRAILTDYHNTYDQHIVTDVTKSIFYQPFLKRTFTISDSDWNNLQARAKQIILKDAVQSFQNIKTFFDTQYNPKTRTSIGVSNFPDGLAYYQERVHYYTTTNLSYEQVYQLGLTEVARIKKEMLTVMKEVKFTGSLQEFISYLRSAPQFYVSNSNQLLKEASFIAKKSDGMLATFFGKLPRQPYGVEAVPAYLAPTYTGGRYSGASIHGKRAAHYWVNTYDLKSRPLYTLEALTLHEAVPGHHLQISLAQELDSLPSFRQNLYVNVFGEGWGLYAEYLGTEMGFYKDSYSHFGRLTYEMWRACRLVLDVALHTKGWTRDQAVQYLSENTALSLREVNTEINRYISWPGQALAYKIGELKIKELRATSEAALKDKFDLREFHDLVLSQGSVTLQVLEGMVNRYIAHKTAK